MNDDVVGPDPRTEFVSVRTERAIKFVARRLLDPEAALGGLTLEEAGLDPDLPLAEAAKAMVRGWAESRDGLMGYLAQWDMLEREVVPIHIIRVYVNGEMVAEQKLGRAVDIAL